MFRYFIFFACFALCNCRIPFDLCEEGFPGPTSFDIPECTSYPCDISIGDEITLNIGIYATRAVTSLPVHALVITENGSFDFPLPNGDACYAIEGGCPQASGEYLVSFPVKIQGLQSGTTATVRVQIDDEQEDVVACGSITTTFK